MTWPIHPLSEIAEVRLGRQRAPKNHQGDSMRPYLRAANVTWSGLSLDDVKSMNFTDDELKTYRLELGDILLSEASGSAGEVGKPALWTGEIADCAFQNTLIRVRPHAHEPKFLLHYFRFQALAGRFVEQSRGVGIHHLGRSRLASWPTPIPPPDEQRRIVDLLEDHLSRLDAAERELHSARTKRDLVWLSTLSSFRRELLDERQTPIGEIAETSLGKMLDAKRQTGMPTSYLRNINVRWGSFDLRDVQLTPLTDADVARFDVRAGDVMACEGGEPGRCAVWREKTNIAFQKALHRIRVRDESQMLPEFLALMLTEAIRSGRSDRLFTGTTIRHLPQEKLRTIEIPTPSIERQRGALAQAEDLTSSQARLGSAIDQALLRASALRRSLLAAAFSGRLTSAASDVTSTAMVEE